MGPLLWSGGHQCVRKKSQSHWLLVNARLGDGHLQRISVTTVLYSHKMPSHKDKGPSKMHLIPETSAVMALTNLANSGAVGGDDVGTNADE